MNSDSSRTSDARDPLLGRILDGRYHVLSCIGKGGMGSVYLAEHVLIRRKVAIKTLHAPLAAQPEIVTRFHREAVAAAAIGNEHVVGVTDMGRLEGGAYYIVLEHLDGADLGWMVASEGRMAIARALQIVLQLCDALRAVHAAGITHRDLKPENLFLIEHAGNPDFLKVLDFGICKIHDANLAKEHRLTGTGVALGTPHFMAPEQVEGRADVDHRADIYAVGAILHFLLTGDPPFDAPTIPRLFMRICYDPPPRVRTSRADVSVELDLVVQRALAKLPDERFADVTALQSALLQLFRRATTEERGARRQRRPTLLARSGIRESFLGPAPPDAGALRTATHRVEPRHKPRAFHGSNAVETPRSGRAWRWAVLIATLMTLSSLLVLHAASHREEKSSQLQSSGADRKTHRDASAPKNSRPPPSRPASDGTSFAVASAPLVSAEATATKASLKRPTFPERSQTQEPNTRKHRDSSVSIGVDRARGASAVPETITPIPAAVPEPPKALAPASPHTDIDRLSQRGLLDVFQAESAP